MKIAVLTNPGNAVDYHRLYLPLKYFPMEDGDSIIFLDSTRPFMAGVLRDTDVVLFSRECPFPIQTVLDLRKQYGFKVVVDVDDFWYLYNTHVAINKWLSTRTSEKIIYTMREADAVITTHDRLASRIKSFNTHVHVVPNALPFGYDQFQYTEREVLQPSVLYVAGISHLGDLKSIAPALHLCANDPMINGKSRLLYAGSDGLGKIGVKLAQVVSLYGNHRMLAPKPIDRYMDFYNEGTVSIAPLQNNDFNTLKSELKVIEAGCKKMPIICSAIHPYLKFEGVMGVWLCKTNNDWYNAIKKFVSDPNRSKVYGEELYLYVKERYNLPEVNIRRRAIFKSLI